MPSSSQLIMLGTGNAMCTRCYNTCFYLRTPGGGLMVDAGGGNGIFRQLYKAHVTVEEVRNLFVTHVHTGHILGVVWMVRKISPMIHKGRHTAPFTIYCNAEVADAVRTICRLRSSPSNIGELSHISARIGERISAMRSFRIASASWRKSIEIWSEAVPRIMQMPSYA